MATYSINLKDGSVEQGKPLILGIDLGTTHSLIAHIQDGKPVCIKDETGKNTLVPSILHISDEGKITVGDGAREKLVIDPAHTIFSVKRLMGKSFGDIREHQHFFGYQIIDDDTDSLVKIRVKDRFYTPVELSALILKALKERAETALGQVVEKAVITVPAYFNDTQRQATRDAGKLAGLDVLRIVNEPTAAALACPQDDSIRTVAVYDLGGGTFDMSILQIQDGIYEVVATNGDTFLGGDDFDREIMQEFMDQAGLSAADISADLQLGQSLRMTAEAAKKQLSTQESFQFTLQGKDLHITRETFEKRIEPYVQRTLDCCKKALADAKLTPEKIERVVMVGGSTRVPMVKSRVAEFFGRPVYDEVNPDEIVALGAAIQADVLAGNQQDILLLDITPLSLGIETVGGLMDTIIPRNSKIPAKAGRQYTTSVDGQVNLKVSVYQGERDLVAHNRKLGEFILKGIPPMPAGLPKIDIQFILNADGILTVRARELRSEVETKVEIRPTYGISEEEMALMLLDSIQNAQSDMAARALGEAVNEGNMMLQAGEKFLVQHDSLLSDAEKTQTRSLMQELSEAVQGTDKDVILKAIESLNQYTTPLAHRAMDATIQEAMRGKKINA